MENLMSVHAIFLVSVVAMIVIGGLGIWAAANWADKKYNK